MPCARMEGREFRQALDLYCAAWLECARFQRKDVDVTRWLGRRGAADVSQQGRPVRVRDGGLAHACCFCRVRGGSRLRNSEARRA